MPREAVVLATYLPPAEADAIRQRAAAGDRSVAAELRRAVRGYLNDERSAANGPLATTSAAGMGDDRDRSG